MRESQGLSQEERAALLEGMEREEKPPQEKEETWLERYNQLLQEGLCPHCERKIERKRQIGRCVYGDPCGHRLYQGKV